MTTNWTIHQLERKSDDGFVVNVHWRYSMTDTDESGKHYYADTYSVISYSQNTEAGDYIPYEELTKDIVISWVVASLDVEEMENGLKLQIEAQKNPPILTGLPWDTLPLYDIISVEDVIDEPEDVGDTLDDDTITDTE
jgi:hypothetical protein